MFRKRIILIPFVLLLLGTLCGMDKFTLGYNEMNNSEDTFQCKLLNLYARIFTDRFPDTQSVYLPVDVPRNYTLGFQLAIKSPEIQQFTIDIKDLKTESGTIFNGNFEVNTLIPVHVEGNTQGSMINVPGGAVPDSWLPYLIRVAPFDVLEAISNNTNNKINVTPDRIFGALIQIKIPENCPPGLYNGILSVTGNLGDMKNIPISFVVHKTTLTEGYTLNSTHWLSPIPENLKSGSPVDWWSETHWKLLVRAGKLLRKNGDNMMFTPLTNILPFGNTAHPLIDALWNPQTEKLTFDFTKLDRWFHTFDTLGFKYFAGYHLQYIGRDPVIKNTVSGEKVTRSEIRVNQECFQHTLLKQLNAHLIAIGMHDRYMQFIHDEPDPVDTTQYKYYSDMLKRYMPGVESIDEFSNHPVLFSPFVDNEVFNLPGIILQKDKIIPKRLNEGKGVWLYNATSPYPPYPNTHLDVELTECRLWPWICMKYNASGYVFWAANLYRGVPDEYETSLGPLPNGSQNPGHPPGDDWFYYRTPDGLIPSMRIICFREGMIDATLWNRLNTLNPTEARNLIDQLIFPEIEMGQDRPWSDYKERASTIPKGYESDPLKFQEVRKQMLDSLDQI